MPTYITAYYNARTVFEIPASLPLLSVEENAQGKPWSWYILWNDLHYLDDKLVEHVIKGEEPFINKKCPSEEEMTTEDDA